ncbi:hypothetical protein [Cellulophaga sp. BC115SP]|uniref:hypothetical protein n=1 Tax=Cellulophaga sp. BC115SP TaxID=2683263 RepID=UPI0014129438|nr:hypothetical protein [Cellulophaga sp. BC115SP]NBB27447.1 hypothetical protein [Cellulophaga sp. BC115SP]
MKKKDVKARLRAKYKDMREDFKKWHNDGYKASVVIQKVADKYYMAEATVEDIVYKTGKYRDQ